MKILIRIFRTLDFLLFYLIKLIRSNLFIAYDILTPRMRTNPGFLEVPVHLNTDLGLLLFSNLLSMTPGTLSIDIHPDRRTMLIHVLYLDSESAIRKEIQNIQDKIKTISE
jgi:multisubunit Na+/H+ antiporter MnhE subunit